MLSHKNLLAIISSHVDESFFLFPDNKKKSVTENSVLTNFNEVKVTVISQLKQLTQESFALSFGDHSIESMLSGALSLALCYINRIAKDKPRIKPRMFVLTVSPDVPAQYVAIMNCIFSAQKEDIPVDSCVLHSQDSPFLQQASHITSGIYLKPPRQEVLLQYLLSVYLTDRYSRRFLRLPAQPLVDFRASCFCHRSVINQGFVCSVCLSIYCDFYPVCSTCGSKFAVPRKKVPTKS
eukprot:TRINITY_DN2518_c0_g1_i1.p1 TRINITY_DN2518_c0_g1~~TRINITY_DN2518_c0_g1_i1.p1  ORF type:complete len:237 (-),score=28.37 TRINITY_DN2518_c0_g1_i1:32-742(-)